MRPAVPRSPAHLAFACFAVLASLVPGPARAVLPAWDPVPAEPRAQPRSLVQPGADAGALLWTVQVDHRMADGDVETTARNVPAFVPEPDRPPGLQEPAFMVLESVSVCAPTGPGAVLLPALLDREEVGDHVAAVQVDEAGDRLAFVRRFRMGLDDHVLFPVESCPELERFFEIGQSRGRLAVVIEREGVSP